MIKFIKRYKKKIGDRWSVDRDKIAFEEFLSSIKKDLDVDTKEGDSTYHLLYLTFLKDALYSMERTGKLLMFAIAISLSYIFFSILFNYLFQ